MTFYVPNYVSRKYARIRMLAGGESRMNLSDDSFVSVAHPIFPPLPRNLADPVTFAASKGRSGLLTTAYETGPW